MARVKYRGGGDWYSNQSALKNLALFCNKNLGTNFVLQEDIVPLNSPSIGNYPFLYLTGHGNIVVNDQEIENLRNYLLGGGFLHIDDNYGLDKFIRPILKKLFPSKEMKALSIQHPIFQSPYLFAQGLPKIHQHDGKPPTAYVIEHKGRIICLYTYESDLGNGWEDFGTYPNDPITLHKKALKMGANIIHYIFTH